MTGFFSIIPDTAADWNSGGKKTFQEDMMVFIHEHCREKQTVTDIASCCALGSSSYFSHLFRRSTGVTPLEYRKQKTKSAP